MRRSAPFASLPRSAFEATLDLLAGRYPSDEFAELRPRIIWDRNAGTIEGRPGAQRLRPAVHAKAFPAGPNAFPPARSA